MNIQKQDMTGKVCLITGATAGIGEATAYLLARQGATVVGIGRNPTKNEASTRMIIDETGNPNVEYLLADLSSQDNIVGVTQKFKDRYDRLDVLVNNAGATFSDRKHSVDGIEMTFALNHLGYFLLTVLIYDLLEASAPSRVINVSSSLHKFGKLDLHDIEYKKGYSRSKAYQRSKLANVAFTYELARRIPSWHVTVNAMNPGLVATNVGESAGGITSNIKGLIDKIAGMPPEEGARTIIYLATSLEVAGVTGKYFEREKSIPSSKQSYDLAFCRQLWDVSEGLVGHIGSLTYLN